MGKGKEKIKKKIDRIGFSFSFILYLNLIAQYFPKEREAGRRALKDREREKACPILYYLGKSFNTRLDSKGGVANTKFNLVSSSLCAAGIIKKQNKSQ